MKKTTWKSSGNCYGNFSQRSPLNSSSISGYVLQVNWQQAHVRLLL